MGTDEETRLTLRLPEWLRDRLTDAAAKNARSMNGEIVARLGAYDAAAAAAANFEKLNKALYESLDGQKAQNEELRHKIAYQEGVISALRSHLQIFIEHLAKPGTGQTEVFEQIMADVREFQAKSKGD